MNRTIVAALLLAACASAPAQVATLTRDQLVKYTEKWQGARFPDGRMGSAPSLATPERGEALVRAAVTGLVSEVEDFAQEPRVV